MPPGRSRSGRMGWRRVFSRWIWGRPRPWIMWWCARRPGPGAVPPPEGYEVELRTESSGAGWRARRSADQARAGCGSDAGRGWDGSFAGRMLMIRVEGGARGSAADWRRSKSTRRCGPRRGSGWRMAGCWTPDGPVQVPSGTAQLSFVPMAAGAADGVTGCRWRLEGWQDSWQEAVMGQTIHSAAARTGNLSDDGGGPAQ